jgi:hypothetical protein
MPDRKGETVPRDSVEELRALGYGVTPPQQYLTDMDPAFFPLLEKVKTFTMISPERAYALYSAVVYIVKAGILGEFVECGVWRGGASMLIAHTLRGLGVENRTIRLYDTFSGMTPPTEEDRINWNERPVLEKWKEDLRGEKDNFRWWAVSSAEVRKNMLSTGYPSSAIKFIEGDVLKTLPDQSPDRIALLRLDTDWYKSTRHELEHLYPRLQPGGILLIDDYGHFTGARKAVDDYFAAFPVFLHRDDYTGRSLVKPPSPRVPRHRSFNLGQV